MPTKKKETKTKKVPQTATKKTAPAKKPAKTGASNKTSAPVKIKKTAALPKDPANFPIVGIGASAGGLEALETLFDNMPPALRIAI